MYQLLTDPVLQQGGDLIFPEYRRVRDGLEFNIRQIKNYRRMNTRYFPGGHLLLRLLGSVPVSMQHDSVQYNDRVSDIAMGLAQSYGLTSALSRGRLHSPGPFLGPNSSEAIILNVDQWDVEEGLKRWEELAPIRYLSHSMTTLKMPVADGVFNTPESGISVITINLPMLMSQYRAWRFKFQMTDESPRTVAQFLQAYPLPNMLDSQVELAILNRLMCIYSGTPIPQSNFRHQFYQIDWSSNVDQVLQKYLMLIGGRRLDFDTQVSHIPVVTSENLHQTLQLPEMPYSVQLQWAIFLARLPIAGFLVKWNHDTGNQRNRPYLNYIRKWLSYVEGNRTLHNALPANVLDEVMLFIDYSIRPYL